MNLHELYEKAHNVPKSLSEKSKYALMAYHKLIPAKYLDINDTMTSDIPIAGYINSNNAVLLMPNIINGTIVDIYVKPLLSAGAPLKLVNSPLPYGIGTLRKDFKFGDPLILVEGIGDYGALKFIDSTLDVVAIGTNDIPASMYSIYANITNNIILIPDNDAAGYSQLKKIIANFKKLDVNVHVVKQYSTMKDTGEILDRYVAKTISKELLLLVADYYKSQIKFIKSLI